MHLHALGADNRTLPSAWRVGGGQDPGLPHLVEVWTLRSSWPTSSTGVVSRDQLRRAELTDAAIDHRVRAGRYHRLFRGVYAVGAPRALRAEGWWQASLLAGGAGARLSHDAAAMARGWIPLPAGPPTKPDGRHRIPLHVTVPRYGRSQAELVVHRAPTLRLRDMGWARFLPADDADAQRARAGRAQVVPHLPRGRRRGPRP